MKRFNITFEAFGRHEPEQGVMLIGFVQSTTAKNRVCAVANIMRRSWTVEQFEHYGSTVTWVMKMEEV